MQSGRAAGPLLGGAAVIVVAGLLYALLQWLERSGWRRRVHRVSEERKFAVELRVNLAILFGLFALGSYQAIQQENARQRRYWDDELPWER